MIPLNLLVSIGFVPRVQTASRRDRQSRRLPRRCVRSSVHPAFIRRLVCTKERKAHKQQRKSRERLQQYRKLQRNLYRHYKGVYHWNKSHFTHPSVKQQQEARYKGYSNVQQMFEYMCSNSRVKSWRQEIEEKNKGKK